MAMNESGGLIGSGLNFIGSMAGLGVQAAQGRKNRRAQAEENAKAQQQMWDMLLHQEDFQRKWQEWRDQYEEDYYNKYNSPEAMVRQYVEAGLNPALLYGGGAGFSGAATSNAGASAAVGAPSAPPSSLPPTHLDTSGLSRIGTDIQQIALMSSQARKNDAEADAISGYQAVESQSRAAYNNASSALLSNQSLTESERQALLRSQTALNSQDLTEMKSKWESQQGLTPIPDPANPKEILNIPLYALDFYLPLYDAALAGYDIRQTDETYSDAVRQMHMHTALMSYTLPQELLASIYSGLEIALFRSNEKVTVHVADPENPDKQITKEMTYSELIREGLSDSARDALDDLRSRLTRTSRENGWQKFSRSTQAIGLAAAGVAAFGKRRPTSYRGAKTTSRSSTLYGADGQPVNSGEIPLTY